MERVSLRCNKSEKLSEFISDLVANRVLKGFGIPCPQSIVNVLSVIQIFGQPTTIFSRSLGTNQLVKKQVLPVILKDLIIQCVNEYPVVRQESVELVLYR